MKLIKKTMAFILVLAFVLAGTVSFAGKAEAATVSRVSFKIGRTASYQRATIKGKTSDGTVVWTYRTKKTTQTQLDSARMIAKSKYVFIVDNNRYIRLNKQTGKVIVDRQFAKKSVSGPAMALDSAGNLYVIGYFGSTLFKVNANGKVVWRHNFPTSSSAGYTWPYKVTLKNGYARVTFDNFGNTKVAKVNMKTGK